MRLIASGRRQAVYTEFQFESKNFRKHGHPLTGCVVIVCWRDNWAGYSKHIEVVELRRGVKSLAGVAG